VSAPLESAPAGAASGRTLLVLDDGLGGGFDWRGALSRLWPRRRWLAAVAAGGAVGAFALSFLLPPVYEASVTLMEAQSSSLGSVPPQLGMLEEQYALRLGIRTSGVSTYPEIVRSRQLLTRVLGQRFPTARNRTVLLLDRLTRPAPAAQRLDLGVRRLRRLVDPALDRRTGILTVRVSLDDPVLAAAVATAACATLQDIVVHLMNAQAGANRRFIEARVAEARRDLARAEDALRAFRENNLRGSSPRLLTEEARLARETRTQEEIMLTLTRQYEIASVEEQKNVPVINVLDPAVPPAFRSAPRRSVLTALGLLLSLACGVAWVLVREPEAAKADVAERV
jgi:uncharacterized protein involved in exopolysaccharide biosynthesis